MTYNGILEHIRMRLALEEDELNRRFMFDNDEHLRALARTMLYECGFKPTTKQVNTLVEEAKDMACRMDYIFDNSEIAKDDYYEH